MRRASSFGPLAFAAALAWACGATPTEPPRPAPEPDPDRDGIAGGDACPAEAEDRDAFEDADGCPEADNDRDRIPDVDDKCPNEPETYDGTVDEDGCPDRGLVIVNEPPPQPAAMAFAPRSAELTARDAGTARAAAAAMVQHPEIGLLLVAGHAADDEGTAKKKIALSLRRAEAVVGAIVAAGVEGDRLIAAGLGDLCPLDARRDAIGRARNRTVELEVLEVDGSPTGVVFACGAAIEAALVPERARPYLPDAEAAP